MCIPQPSKHIEGGDCGVYTEVEVRIAGAQNTVLIVALSSKQTIMKHSEIRLIRLCQCFRFQASALLLHLSSANSD